MIQSNILLYKTTKEIELVSYMTVGCSQKESKLCGLKK